MKALGFQHPCPGHWSMAPLPCGISGRRKGSGVNPAEIRRGAPKAVHWEHDYLPTASVVKLVPNILLCSPLDYISEAERWILTTGHPSLPNTGGSSYGSYVQAYWRRSVRYRLPPTVGGIIASHRSAITRLKLGTLQPVR